MKPENSPSRREFVQGAAALAASAIIPTSRFPLQTPMSKQPDIAAYRVGRPLLELQQEFVDLRFGMFLHFNLATFQDREWGDPTDPPTVFYPTDLDTDQWAAAAKSAGMTYACLTTKHHDGFPIWPTKTKVDNIAQSGQNLDVVARYAESFRKAGLKVCLYYSILDLRNDIRHFNVTPEKIQLIKDQLTELLTHYGEITMLIFDGWDAPWSRITYDEVPFHEIYALVKSLQPDCLICDLNAGKYPPSGLYYSDIKAFEQNAGQEIPDNSTVPALSCVTLTPGWFWKQNDVNADLKPVDTIVNEWLKPQNALGCNLILNAPPDRRGRLADNLVNQLAEIGKAMTGKFEVPTLDPHLVITTPNLLTGRPVHASMSPDTVGPDEANDGNFDSTWRFEDSETGWLEVKLAPGTTINTLALVEPVGRWDDYRSTRIQSYMWEARISGTWQSLIKNSNDSPTRIHRVPKTKTDRLRLTLTKQGTNGPHIAEIGAYLEPV